MRTRPSSPQLIYALACSALLVTACGGSDRPTGTKPRPNTNNTTNNNNSNNNNSGGDCSANPNNCAPNELIGAAPGCTCLNVCATGFQWNPNSMVCDPIGNNNNNNNNNNQNNNNSNNNNNQNNNNSNNNNNNMGPECATAADCPTAGDLCVEPQNLDTCAGQQDCLCITQCSPNVANPGCDPGEVCFWTNGAGVEGACIQDPGGQAHGQPCNAMFDPAGNPTGDNCAVNHYCWGASAMAPTGTCGRLCPPNDTVVCPALGNYACDTSVSQDGSIGLCFEPAPATTDDGVSCMSGADCTTSGRCLNDLAGICGADCSGLQRCHPNSACVPFNAPVGETCVPDCTMGGTPTCAAIDPSSTCHRFADGQGGTFGLCFPNCQTVLQGQCFSTQQTCNTTTGECM